MENIEKVNKFLDENPTFFLATADGNQPKCRPLGAHFLKNGKLYFSVGDFKAVYRQLKANPLVEIVALNSEGTWLRYHGKAVFETTDDLEQQILEAMPSFKEVYNEKTEYHLAFFHLEEATAEFINGMEVSESYSF